MPFLFLSSQVLPSPNSVCGCCGRHALFPPKGEEEKSQGEKERHAEPRLHSEHNLADVLALGNRAVRVSRTFSTSGGPCSVITSARMARSLRAFPQR